MKKGEQEEIMGMKDIFKKIEKEKKVIEGEATKNTFYSSQNRFPDIATAEREFERSKKKLFDVSRWSDLPGATSRFTLYNGKGERKASGNPQVGDFLQIDLPKPAPANWVKVIDIKVEENMAEFIVSPSSDPRKLEEGTEEIEHFFIDEATSTFRVRRRGKSIFAYEIGKDEGINNKGKEAGERKLINTLIAEGGWALFQKLQWENLTDYLVHKTAITK